MFKISSTALVFGILVILLASLASMGQKGCNGINMTQGTDPVKNVQIIIYQEGGERHLDPANIHFAELQVACEEALISADDMVAELISKQDIARMKRQDLVVELLYPEAKRFLVPLNQSKIDADRLLLKIMESAVIIYFAYPEMEYSAGPYVNRGDIGKRIREMLESI